MTQNGSRAENDEKCCGELQVYMSTLSTKSLVNVTVDNEGIATLQMQRAPVNALNLELIQELRESIIEVEKNKCKGLILTSEIPKNIFSAGLDLKEFISPDVKKLTKIKHGLLDAVVKLFGTDIITTVAINGYTGAGACVLTLACEYRTMTAGEALIGLNDTAVGLEPAKWIADLMTRAMGSKNAEYALTSSHMFPTTEAMQVGFVDDVATDKIDAVEKCQAFIKRYDHIPPAARAATKRSMRQHYLTELEKHRNKYVTDFINIITRPEFQNSVIKYVQRLKQREAVNRSR